MKALYTLHAGEYLVGAEIEKRFKNLKLWIPSKDKGIDFLVTDKTCKKSVSLQVKYSKDHLEGREESEERKNVKAGGWWSFDKDIIEKSSADYWVLVLSKSGGVAPEFIIIKPKDLLLFYNNVFPGKQKVKSHARVMKDGKCWEARGLKKDDKEKISQGTYRPANRNLTKYLNNWTCLEKLNAR